MLFKLLTLIGFFYLLRRISSLEDRISPRSRGQSITVQSAPSLLVPPPRALGRGSFAVIPESAVIPSVTDNAHGQQSSDKASVGFRLEKGWEEKLGQRVFTIIGAVAVLLAVGFFMRWAFATGLITEAARILIGIVAGVGLIVIGWLLPSRYVSYGRILIGTGVGVLYVSIYAAYAFYALVGFPLALLWMSLVTVLGVGLALYLDAQELAILAAVGGFLTPVLLPFVSEMSALFFAYLTILNLGLLAISWARAWRRFAIGCFMATALLYTNWLTDHFAQNHYIWLLVLFYLSIFFLTYVAVTLLHYFRHRRSLDDADTLLALINPVFFFSAGYAVIGEMVPAWDGFFAFVLAALYAALWVVLKRFSPGAVSGSRSGHELLSLVAGIAAAFFVLVVPLQFHSFTITIVWALQALLLIYAGLRANLRDVRIAGLLLFGLTFTRVFFFDTAAIVTTPWFNPRLLTAGVVMFAAALTALFYREYIVLGDSSRSREFTRSPQVLRGLAYLTAFTFLTLEISQFYSTAWLAIVWILLAVSAVVWSFAVEDRPLRTLGFITVPLAIVQLWSFAWDMYLVNDYPFLDLRVLSAAVIVGVLWGVVTFMGHHRDQMTIDENDTIVPTLALIAHSVALWVVSVEVIDYMATTSALGEAERVALSLVWLGYGLVVLVWGVACRSALARTISLVVLGLAALKIFIYDTTALPDLYRFISFLVLGVILLGVGYVYHRYNERIRSFVSGQ
jgi:uncharacterized membrane protein